MKKIFVTLCLIAIIIIPQLGCNAQAPNNNQGISKSSFHLDTVCSVTIYSMEGTEGKSAEEIEKEALLLITEAFKLCDEYEGLLSKTIKTSDVYKVNNAGGRWVQVDESTLEVIKKGLEYGEISGGLFDITIGDITDLWDFHGEEQDGNKTGILPDKSKLEEAVKHVDYRNVEIKDGQVRLSDSSSSIDLGGIAKGYIADKVAQFLESEGVTSAVVDLGGNIVVIGQKGSSVSEGEGTDFAIGVADPMSDSRELLGTVSCSDKTVVTSGTYERYFEVGGVRYHHVLDPDTGFPVDTDLMSVTVIGERGASADCDGISTTCLALGKEKASRLIEETEGIGGILVDMDGQVTVIDVDEFNRA